MLKSQILEKLHHKYNNLNLDDIEGVFDLFIKKILNTLKIFNMKLMMMSFTIETMINAYLFNLP